MHFSLDPTFDRTVDVTANGLVGIAGGDDAALAGAQGERLVAVQSQLARKAGLELFVPVCQAIQHAHQKGIIHRDS